MNKPQQVQQLPGSKLLKIVGNIYYILAILSAITLLPTLIRTPDIERIDGVYIVTAILATVITVIAIIAGISANRYHDVIEKANLLFKLGIALLILVAVNLIIGVISIGAINPLSFVGLVLPILYIVGARQNKKAVQ